MWSIEEPGTGIGIVFQKLNLHPFCWTAFLASRWGVKYQVITVYFHTFQHVVDWGTWNWDWDCVSGIESTSVRCWLPGGSLGAWTLWLFPRKYQHLGLALRGRRYFDNDIWEFESWNCNLVPVKVPVTWTAFRAFRQAVKYQVITVYFHTFQHAVDWGTWNWDWNCVSGIESASVLLDSLPRVPLMRKIPSNYCVFS